jgi:hypothetical protein
MKPNVYFDSRAMACKGPVMISRLAAEAANAAAIW